MSRSPLEALEEGGPDLDALTRRVVAVALVALALRLVLLGDRVAHFDEGHVGWWTLHFLDTGQFEYRFIIHGPLVQHVNRVVFAVFGANDVTLRLFVALVGAALPLAALLFREHLRDDEVIGVAAFLAANPLLVYYSRFFRSTLLVAAFSFVAFGLLVRAVDERSVRYVHGAVVFVALAFTAKENAAVYVLCWLGATALVVDHRLFRTGSDESGVEWLRERVPDRETVATYRARLPRYLGHLGIAAVSFFAVTLYFYAPRSPDPNLVGFWQGVTNPTAFPAMVGRTVENVVTGYEHWFGGSTDPGCRKDNLVDGYLCYLGRSLESLSGYALPLVVLSVAGFLAERWARSRPRLVVLFAGYWGFVSVLGYPLGTDIYGAWIMVNAVVPLAIPAGVGLAMVVRWTGDALHADAVRFGLAAFVLFLVVGQVAFALSTGVYLDHSGEDNTLVQYAQPADDFRPALDVLDERAESHEGTDVLLVGFPYIRDTPRRGGIEPRCSAISDTLPLQWYIETHDATADCTANVTRAEAEIAAADPLVVVAPTRLTSQLAELLPGYARRTGGLRTYGSQAVFFSKTANATAG